MKKIYLLSILFLCALGMFAQTPQKMNYQTVVRNSSDMILANQSVGIQISILQGSALGTAVYVETQTPTTNANGLASIEIGTGSIVSGDFSTIDWANDTYFIKTEIDIAGGTNYTITGTSQLASVPYALHAKTAESVSGTVNYTETDPVYSASPANNITTADITTLSNTSGTNTGDQDITGIAANATAISAIQTEQTTQNTAIALNTDKVGITAQQASDITANNAKVSDVNHVASSTTDDLTEGTTNLYYTEARVSANTDVVANTAKTGITAQQASDITANNAKVSDVNHVTSSTTDDLTEGTTNLYYTEARVSANTDVVANTAKISVPAGGTINQVLKSDGAGNHTWSNVQEAMIEDTAITTAKIRDNTITTSDLASQIITNAKMATDAIGSVNIIDNGIQEADINTDAIVTRHIQASAVTSEKLSNMGAFGGGTSDGWVLTYDAYGADKWVAKALPQTTVIDNLTSTNTTAALSANQGKVLEDTKAAKTNVLTLNNVTAFVPSTDYEPATKKYVDDTNVIVENVLTSTNTTAALSANQGKVLEDTKAAKTNVLTLNNVTAFVPSTDYEPATKKYVDDTNIIVENVLTSTNATTALSAAQGKVLEDTKLNKTLASASVFVGDASNNAVATTISGDATLANNGTLTIANNAVAGTDISLANEAAGDIMYNNGTDWVRLPKGTAGQALAINAGETAPEWVTIPSISSSPLDNAEYTLPDQNLSWGTSGTVSFAAQQFTVPAGKHDILVQFAFNIRGYFFTWGKYTVELYDVTNSVSIKQIDVQYKTTISNPTYGGSNPTADIPFARTYTLNTAVDTVYQINVIYSFATGDANTSGNITAGNVIVRKVN